MADFIPSPVMFRGGVPADYEIVKASTDTLMTRHISTGAQRLSDKAGAPAKQTKGIGKLAGPLNALNAVTGAVSAIASAYGAYESRRTRRETERPGAKVANVHEDCLRR